MQSIKHLASLAPLLLLNIAAILSATSGLRINSVQVPSAVMNGSQATLHCDYDLQGDQLYSVKWYKNYVEFFRFQPSATGENQGTTFDLDGIAVVTSKSNATHLHLRQISEGTYKCEVSADSPSFATVSMERQLKVYALPKHKLTILDESISTAAAIAPNNPQPDMQIYSNSYNLNDLLNFTCTSSPSKPQAKLAWYVNDVLVPKSSRWLTYGSQTSNGTGGSINQLESARLTLAFRLQPSHPLVSATAPQNNTNRLATGQMVKLRCVARLTLEYSSESSVVVSGGHKSVLKKRQQIGTSTSSPPQSLQLASSLRQQQTPQDQPADLDPFEPLKWPRPRQKSPISGRRSAVIETRTNSADLVDSQPTDFLETTTIMPPPSYHPNQTKTRRIQQPVVWTNHQIWAQAQHISQLLQNSRPNELDQPAMEARVRRYRDEFESQDESIGRGQGASGQDYQLNDIVEFTCHPYLAYRVGPDSGPPRSTKSVHLQWFINNNEVSVDHINHFDGTNFVHLKVTKRMRNLSMLSNDSTNVDDEGGDQSAAPRDKPNESILIEFTPSLFQLKEINVKCRTVVEQPLIEYENQVVAILQQGSHSIQASEVPHPRHRSSSFVKTPANGRHNNNRHSPGSSRNAKSSSSARTYQTMPILAVATAYFLILLQLLKIETGKLVI